MHRPLLLIILDGFGERQESQYNAIRSAPTPTIDYLLAHYPHTLLAASGNAVGLPKGQMGNSEVGHLHIGSGRKVPQDLTRITASIERGEFYHNQTLQNAIKQAKKVDGAVHIIGLLSEGGVHSHSHHIATMIDMTHQAGITKNYCHAILDGRDTPPQSATAALKKLMAHYAHFGDHQGQIATIIGRYYAMDRDHRWDRTQLAYDCLTQGKTPYTAPNAIAGLEAAYARNETDEFVKPTTILSPNQHPIVIQDNDVVIMMNFRADRARQLTSTFTEKNFSAFPRKVVPTLTQLVTLTAYAKDSNAAVAFPPLTLKNTLGDYLSQQGLHQLRIAETEKYAHVTYFLNGGIETPYPGEDRILIPSPLVSTYDLKPDMSANEVTQALIHAIFEKKYDVIVCNFANPDMLGHTGNEEATEKAIATIDTCLKRILEALHNVGGEALITADHGNAELMFDEKTKQPHTAHTNNLVPCIYVGRESQFLATEGALDDVAPTLLYLLGLKSPPEMTGRNLLILK